MGGGWDFTSFRQFIIFAQSLIIMHMLHRQCQYKVYREDKSNFVRACYLLNLLGPMRPSVGVFAISFDGYFYKGE